MADLKSNGSSLSGYEHILRAIFVDNKSVTDIHNEAPMTTSKKELLQRTAFDGFEEGVKKQVLAYEQAPKKRIWGMAF